MDSFSSVMEFNKSTTCKKLLSLIQLHMLKHTTNYFIKNTNVPYCLEQTNNATANVLMLGLFNARRCAFTSAFMDMQDILLPCLTSSFHKCSLNSSFSCKSKLSEFMTNLPFSDLNTNKSFSIVNSYIIINVFR